MMKSLYLLIISATISNVIAIRCQCTEGYCDNAVDICHSKYRYCFTQTTGNDTSRGCLEYNDFMASVVCHLNAIKCCDTDFCNGDDSTRIQYALQLPVPNVQLVNNSRGTVTILINDSDVVRSKIDGYIATAYTAKESGQITKKIKSHSHLFSIDDLHFNTTYVVEVSSYKGDVISNRSQPITMRTQNAVCAYYSRGQLKSNNQIKQCREFWCFSLWTKSGTKTAPVLLRRGCWNKQLKNACTSFDRGNSLFCACKEEKCLLPSSEQIQV